MKRYLTIGYGGAAYLVFVGYILIALRIEERSLVAALGDQYRDYRRGVPMLLPRRRLVCRQPAETVARARISG